MCIVFGISRRKVPCNIFHAASLRSSSIFPSKRISKLNILADKTYFPHLLYICSSSWSHNILSCSSCRPLWSIPSTSTIVATTTSIVARCYSNASKCTVSSLYCSSFSNNRWISLRIYIYILDISSLRWCIALPINNYWTNGVNWTRKYCTINIDRIFQHAIIIVSVLIRLKNQFVHVRIFDTLKTITLENEKWKTSNVFRTKYLCSWILYVF